MARHVKKRNPAFLTVVGWHSSPVSMHLLPQENIASCFLPARFETGIFSTDR
ncbi:hypothetical protein OHAE_2790 [Ochrobactrum soli]|uniref:Uncharacterized protein n=1 Tax=Ochrobactrum soli TaxID=2448455 RepID=A0A2P9HFI7_9HYPH|nr:hypothetical protein OHAE_2790 [[Ochrobactrum] soli]